MCRVVSWIAVVAMFAVDYATQGNLFLGPLIVGVLWFSICGGLSLQLQIAFASGLLTLASLMYWDCDGGSIAQHGAVIGICAIRFHRAFWHLKSAGRLASLTELSGRKLVDESGPSLDFGKLTPAIDLISESDFRQRLESSGAFDSSQITELTTVHRETNHLDKGLKALSENGVITEFQAVNILWGREDRLRVDNFLLVDLVGIGGMGTVYKAVRSTNGESVALKVLSRRTKHGFRFSREMELVEKLAHPNIVVAYEVGETPDKFYIAMELVDGPDLAKLVAEDGPIDADTAWDYILQAARGLEQAHARGIVHRDIKPGNLLLSESGTIKVADLGLSWIERGGASDDESFQTNNDGIFGTIDFMPPEQAQSADHPTPCMDVYALGSTLFYLLTGQSQIPGKTAIEKAMNLTVKREFRGLPAGMIDEDARAVLYKMLSYSPDDRYQSMTELIEAMEEVSSTHGEGPIAESVRILVVEDSAAQMFVTLNLLKESNKSLLTTEAGTLADAIRAANESKQDIALLDLNLPDSEGVATVRDFRKSHPSIPIIVLTGQESTQMAQDCVAAGADEFLPKEALGPSQLERAIFITLSRIATRKRMTS